MYTHLQKDQHLALAPHAAQCILIGYPCDYKGWSFWDPVQQKELISDSVAFHKSIFPFCKPSLSGLDCSVDLLPPTENSLLPNSATLFAPLAAPVPVSLLLVLQPLCLEPALAPAVPVSPVIPAAVPEPPEGPACLIIQLHVPPRPVSLAVALDILEHPRTPPAVKLLMSNFKHHLDNSLPLPVKCVLHGRLPGALVEANLTVADKFIPVPVVDAIKCVFATSAAMEPRSLAKAVAHLDGESWIVAALLEIEPHLENGTWELAQLPTGHRAIRSHWVFKVKQKANGLIDKYKGQIVAQGFSQVCRIHYNEVFTSTVHMAAMRTVIAIAAVEDLELDSVDVSTAFLNSEIDAKIYMKIPEGLSVEGDPAPGEDLKCWVVHLLKGLYGIKQGPQIWAFKLHLVLTDISFKHTDCDHSIYIYGWGAVQILLPIHVDDLLLASNSCSALQSVKSKLASHFKLHDLGPMTSILGMKLDCDCQACTISLSQPGYIESILQDFQMANCNPLLMPMEESLCLSLSMSPSTVEERLAMKGIPYCELVRKLLYLAVATCPDISYTVGVLCCFVENPGVMHWEAGKCILHYLRGTTPLSLVYSLSSSPVHCFTTFSDANLGGNPDNSRSMGGFTICMASGAVQWGSWLHPHVLLSSTKSEYTTVSKVRCEVMWMRYLLDEFGYDMAAPSTVLMDNASAIQVAKHPEHQLMMKHVHQAYHWIHSCVEGSDIMVSHVPGAKNPTDIFTKPLGWLKFAKFQDMLGLH